MFSAILFGVVGVALCVLIGVQHLGHSLTAVAQAMGVSMVTGFIALFTMVNIQHVRAIKAFMPNVLTTWIVFVSLYTGLTWAFLPAEFTPREFAYLYLPLVFVTGFPIIVFGPLQDRMVARRQRKSK